MKISFKQDQICKWIPGKGFEFDGNPIYITGVNYVTRYVCTNFWEDWRPDVIKKDLEKISNYGHNEIRIPVHWEYSEPQPGEYNKNNFKKFDWILNIAEDNGLFVMPFFLVGICTANYDVSWRNSRSFFEEPMLTYAANNIKEYVSRFKNRPNILCWDLCDEPEYYSFFPDTDKLPYKDGLIKRWTQKLYNTVKEIDKDHCVNVGFSHINNNNWGIDIREIADILDCMTVTCYPPFMSKELFHSIRNNYFIGWNVRINDIYGKGVFSAEAPGGSNSYASEESMGKYYKVTLYSNLINGSMGTLPWVWNDYDSSIHTSGILNINIHEPYFGISRKDGSLKPAGMELVKFTEFIKNISIHEWQYMKNEIDVFLPDNYYKQIDKAFLPVYHSYILARSAGLYVNYIWEGDDLSKGKNPVFIPTIENYYNKSWYSMLDFVKNGGTLYCSYGGIQQLGATFNELFGVKVEGHKTIYKDLKSKFENKNYKNISIKDYPAGKTMIVVKPYNAKIIAFSEDNDPLILVNNLGKGKSYLLTYPLESAISTYDGKDLYESNLHNLYYKVFCDASGEPDIYCQNPEIELALFKKENEKLIILINHSDRSISTKIISRSEIKNINCLDDIEIKLTNANICSLTIPACGVVKAIIR